MDGRIQILERIVYSEKKVLGESLGFTYEEIEPTLNCIWRCQERIKALINAGTGSTVQ